MDDVRCLFSARHGVSIVDTYLHVLFCITARRFQICGTVLMSFCIIVLSAFFTLIYFHFLSLRTDE